MRDYAILDARMLQITMRPCTSDELKALEESRQEFHKQKAAAVQKTPYGLSYSPHYLRQSRLHEAQEPDQET